MIMSKTILLVEDNDDARQMLAFYLEYNGYRVVEAADGYDAIEYVYQTLPDIILMDLSLPDINGLETTRHIKNIPDAGAIPVVCVTAHGQYYKEEAIEVGCKEILPKPVDLDNLIKVVEHYTGV